MKRIRIDRPRPRSAAPEVPPQEDLSFEELMDQGGVKRLEGDVPRKPAPPKPAPATIQQEPAPPSSPPESTPAATCVDPEAAEELRERVVELESENARLEQELAEARADHEAVDTERRALARRLGAAQETVAKSETQPLFDLLERRGCRDEREREECMQHIVQAGDVDRFLALVATADAPALGAILDHAVSFVCERPECRPAAGSKPLVVEPDRCEVCGGSDLQLAATRLFDTCVKRGLRRIRVIGGSPTYHTQLRDLAEASKVDLKLISGIQHRTEKQARADQKHSDLVVLWGGTLLDHSTSGLYDRTRSAVLTVAHRGLAGMLSRLEGMLDRE